MVMFRVGKCPSDELSLTNRVILNATDHNTLLKGQPHISVTTGPGSRFVFTVECDERVPKGHLGFSMPQRKWAVLSLNQELEVLPHRFEETKDYIGGLVLHVDFFNKKKVTKEPFDTDAMAAEFLQQFPRQAFTVGQPLVFQFGSKPLLQVVVGDIQTTDLSAVNSGQAAKMTKATIGLREGRKKTVQGCINVYG